MTTCPCSVSYYQTQTTNICLAWAFPHFCMQTRVTCLPTQDLVFCPTETNFLKWKLHGGGGGLARPEDGRGRLCRCRSPRVQLRCHQAGISLSVFHCTQLSCYVGFIGWMLEALIQNCFASIQWRWLLLGVCFGMDFGMELFVGLFACPSAGYLERGEKVNELIITWFRVLSGTYVSYED